jgi:ABC-type multidrug transport system fused ATPase/permease subunit
MRLYNVDKGSVLIDGESLGDADGATLHKLRGKMAVVNQEPALFATSIRDNIRYGSEPGVTEDEIEAAARAASADTFINDFPDGLDTLVGERGVQLSGGQKQRVAIARAIARKAPIVLLDEATSALDAESEHLVVEALDALVAGDRTVISIAHRLSTMRAADVIAVVRDGRVVEVGHYDALVAKKDSELSALVQRQLERKE